LDIFSTRENREKIGNQRLYPQKIDRRGWIIEKETTWDKQNVRSFLCMTAAWHVFSKSLCFFLVLRFFGRQAALAEEARRRRQREEEVSDAVVVAV
jgi:hypothetical protein